MRVRIVSFIIMFTICLPFSVNSGFSFKGAWKSISSLPGKIGNFAAGATGIGGLVEGSFEPAINKLEEANRRSINLLDEKLALRLNQFNNVLEAREDQLDEIFKTSIYLMDESVKDNINKIDESLKMRIGQLNSGLSNVSYGFSSSLWTVFKGVATFALLFFLIYLIENFVSQYITNKQKGLQQENKRLLKRFYVRAGILGLGFFFIYLFQPTIFKRFEDPALRNQITAIESNLITSSRSLNYNESIYYASLLTSYEIENSEYQYNLLKYSILRDFINRPKLTLFSLNNIQELQSKLTLLEEHKHNAEKANKNFKDPDFEVINALFFANVLNNKEGDLIAAYLCNSAISSNGNNFSLKPLASDLINTYLFHPLSMDSAKKILNDYSLLGINEPFPALTTNSFLDCNSLSGSLLCSNYNYNSIVKELQIDDEKDFLNFISPSSQGFGAGDSQQTIGKRMVERWVEALLKIDDLSRISNNINSKVLSLNDSYINYVINHTPANLYSVILKPITDKTNPIAATLFPEKLPNNQPNVTDASYTTAKNSFKELTEIRKFLVSKFLTQFNFLSRMPFLNLEINKEKNNALRIENLVKVLNTYDNVNLKINQSKATQEEIFLAYSEYALALAEEDIYIQINKNSSPLAMQILLDLQKVTVETADSKKEIASLRKRISALLIRKSHSFL